MQINGGLLNEIISGLPKPETAGNVSQCTIQKSKATESPADIPEVSIKSEFNRVPSNRLSESDSSEIGKLAYSVL